MVTQKKPMKRKNRMDSKPQTKPSTKSDLTDLQVKFDCRKIHLSFLRLFSIVSEL